jgi:RNA polymerase sigma-70 factor (ECF subfamily)
MVIGQTDEELMLRYRDGDAAAFETLYQRYERPLFDFIYRMAPNAADCESLFQETFFRLVRAKGRYRASAQFRTWLFQIAANLCRDRARRMKHRAHLSLNDPVFAGHDGRRDTQGLVSDPTAPVGASVETGEIEAAVKGAVGALPEDERAVVVLKEYHELTYPEIAEIMGRPVGTLKSVHHRACEKLRGVLASYLGE